MLPIIGDGKCDSPLFLLPLSHVASHWKNLIGVQLASEARKFSFQPPSFLSYLAEQRRVGRGIETKTQVTDTVHSGPVSIHSHPSTHMEFPYNILFVSD